MSREAIAFTREGSCENSISNGCVGSKTNAIRAEEPYSFKCDNTVVRVTFNPKGRNLEEAMLEYFSRISEI